MGYILVSSNENKLNEFRRMGLDDIQIEKGRDLDEVDSDTVTVILYKAKDAGENRIVEDTSLHIEGANVGTNIRWQLDSIGNYNGRHAVWEVFLGVNTGDTIQIYKGEVKGTICVERINNLAFGFDSYFIPDESNSTLYELEKEGLKDSYSARMNAIVNLLNRELYDEVKIRDILEWTGDYQ